MTHNCFICTVRCGIRLFSFMYTRGSLIWHLNFAVSFKPSVNCCKSLVNHYSSVKIPPDHPFITLTCSSEASKEEEMGRRWKNREKGTAGARPALYPQSTLYASKLILVLHLTGLSDPQRGDCRVNSAQYHDKR